MVWGATSCCQLNSSPWLTFHLCRKIFGFAYVKGTIFLNKDILFIHRTNYYQWQFLSNNKYLKSRYSLNVHCRHWENMKYFLNVYNAKPAKGTMFSLLAMKNSWMFTAKDLAIIPPNTLILQYFFTFYKYSSSNEERICLPVHVIIIPCFTTGKTSFLCNWSLCKLFNLSVIQFQCF